MKKENPKHSGFECPVIGHTHPKGSIVKYRPDGTCYVVEPDEQDNSGEKELVEKEESQEA